MDADAVLRGEAKNGVDFFDLFSVEHARFRFQSPVFLSLRIDAVEVDSHDVFT